MLKNAIKRHDVETSGKAWKRRSITTDQKVGSSNLLAHAKSAFVHAMKTS